MIPGGHDRRDADRRGDGEGFKMALWGRSRIRFSYRSAALAGGLVVLLLARGRGGRAADPPTMTSTATPTKVRATSASAALIRARYAAIAASIAKLPKRVFRAHQSGAPAAGNARQDVLVGAIRANKPFLADAHYCTDHPFLLDRVSGDVTPGGTITATGACFGTAGGQVQMLGNFPNTNGVVRLTGQSWADDTVTATIPAIAGAPDQAVEIRLQHLPNYTSTTSVRSKGPPQIVSQIVSLPVQMRFLALRQKVNASLRVENLSCAHGAYPNSAYYGWCRTDPTDWLGQPDPQAGAYHNQGKPDSGTDTWGVRLPTGWRFDSIGLGGNEGEEVVIDQTIDPTNVTWSVRWHTTSSIYDHQPEYNAGYAFYLYAIGPWGTYK